MRWLEKYADYAYALMRIVSGFMFWFHGAQKLLGLFSNFKPALGSQLWFGGIIEFIAGLCIMFGLQTRIAAFISSGTMAVAYFQYHWKFQLGAQLFPTINQGELAALYCFVFLYIASRGGVKWGLQKTT
jgi:putative oxidoreductase